MIDVSDQDGLRIITLNRKDKANALTRDMLEEIAAGFSDASEKSVVILTGTGRVFSAGADLDAARAGLATDTIWQTVSDAIRECRGLTIAALNGTAAGGAFGMILDCDIRIATPQAKLFYPVIELGFLPQRSHVTAMRELCGPAKAKLILAAGHRFTAEIGKSFGLIDVLVDGDVLEYAVSMAALTLDAPQSHLHAIKSMI